MDFLIFVMNFFDALKSERGDESETRNLYSFVRVFCM